MMQDVDADSFQEWFEEMSRRTWAPSREGIFLECRRSAIMGHF